MDKENGEQSKSFSFKFSRTKQALPVLKSDEKFCDFSKEDDPSIELVYAAEGSALKSSKEKHDKELVIPCRKTTDSLLDKLKINNENTLENQAAKEIIQELTSATQETNTTGNNFSIPLTSNQDDSAGNAVNLEDESTLEDYDTVPVSEFGAAMLRGMGWKKGQAIGGTNKGLTVPIEFIPRSQGLGLGAERISNDNEKKRRRKPGDKDSSEKFSPILKEDGKVQHYRGLDDKPSNRKVAAKKISKGAYIVIENGVFKEMSGKIISNDDVSGRIDVILAINDKKVTINHGDVRLVTRDEYLQFSKGNLVKSNKSSKRLPQELNSDKQAKKQKTQSRNDDNEKDKIIYKRSREKCWMVPLLRVRIIDKTYKNGRYYHQKVVIEDVISQTKCICRTSEGKLLDDVFQSSLETVIPKVEPRYILFVQGQLKGQIGEIVELESTRQKAVVQILLSKKIVRSHYDDICEYTGDVSHE